MHVTPPSWASLPPPQPHLTHLGHHRAPSWTPWLIPQVPTLCFIHQFSSVAQWCPTLCDPMDSRCQVSLSVTNSRSLLKLMSIKSVMPSNHLILCCPLLLLPSIFPTIRVFSNESVLHIRWPKYWSFSISPSNVYSGLSSFRIDWFDRLALQGTLSRVFSNTTVQKHKFSGTQLCLWSNSQMHTWLLEKP